MTVEESMGKLQQICDTIESLAVRVDQTEERVVQCNVGRGEDREDQINDLLAAGWRVASVTSGEGWYLAVLERKRPPRPTVSVDPPVVAGDDLPA